MTETIYEQYKKIIIFLGITVLLVFGVKAAFAQTQSANESTESAKKYGVTFPISELGGCKDISSCRTFCEDPLNYTTCINYAKAKGFYKEDIPSIKKDEILAKAKQSFGCDSFESCKAYCDKPENTGKCNNFAKRNNLTGGEVRSVEDKKIMEKAKDTLGCTSPQDCMTFCGLETNKKKCSEFAKEVGLRGGEQPVGPGGCTTESTCKSFCSDPQNYNMCSSYSKSVGVGSFSGPGGCITQESCATFCKQNPEKCRSFNDQSGSGGYNRQEMCSRTPNCTWSNNTCVCGSYGGNNYSNTCPQNYYFGPGGVCTPLDKSQDAWRCSQSGRYWDGTSCRDSSPEGTTGNYNPQDMCNRTTNCSWVNKSCQCANNGEIRTYTPGSTDGYFGSRESQESACKAGGGTCDWSSGTCYCKGYQNPKSTSTTNYSPNPGSSGSTSGGYGSRDSQESTCKAGGGTCDWSPGYCRCNGYNSPNTTSTGGNYNSASSQESTCRAGGGTCDWSSGYCRCNGYQSPTGTNYSSGTYNTDPATGCRQVGGTWTGSYCQMPTSTSTTTNTTTNTAPPGMSRDSQQAGCSSCGGTCNWNGDFCSCQCANSGSTSTSAPSSTTAPSSTNPPSTSAPSSTTAPQSSPAPSVQGVSISTNRSFFQIILDLIFGKQ